MASEVLIIRYPDGDAEFWAGGDVPSVGDSLTRRNADWTVAHVDADTDGCVRVIVMPARPVRDDSWPKPFQFVAFR